MFDRYKTIISSHPSIHPSVRSSVRQSIYLYLLPLFFQWNYHNNESCKSIWRSMSFRRKVTKICTWLFCSLFCSSGVSFFCFAETVHYLVRTCHNTTAFILPAFIELLCFNLLWLYWTKCRSAYDHSSEGRKIHLHTLAYCIHFNAFTIRYV